MRTSLRSILDEQNPMLHLHTLSVLTSERARTWGMSTHLVQTRYLHATATQVANVPRATLVPILTHTKHAASLAVWGFQEYFVPNVLTIGSHQAWWVHLFVECL